MLIRLIGYQTERLDSVRSSSSEEQPYATSNPYHATRASDDSASGSHALLADAVHKQHGQVVRARSLTVPANAFAALDRPHPPRELPARRQQQPGRATLPPRGAFADVREDLVGLSQG